MFEGSGYPGTVTSVFELSGWEVTVGVEGGGMELCTGGRTSYAAALLSDDRSTTVFERPGI